MKNPARKIKVQSLVPCYLQQYLGGKDGEPYQVFPEKGNRFLDSQKIIIDGHRSYTLRGISLLIPCAQTHPITFMLKFYGIRFNQKGAPERFSLSFALGESLHAGLRICEQLGTDSQVALKVIDTEIEKLFQTSEAKKNNRQFRFVVAKWFRTRDIVQFLLAHSESAQLKLDIARILDSRDSIEDKWIKIEPLVIGYVGALSSQERENALSNQESDINLLLQMIALFFLEQDDEVPPPNLELQFIRYQFPRIIWKKRDGFNSSSNPFWLPKNQLCQSPHLLTRVISGASKIVREEEATLSTAGVITQEPLNTATPISLKALIPETFPDKIQLDLNQEEDGGNQQLQLLPESISETFLTLQKLVQKQYSHDGVKHLLGILRQLAESTTDGFCVFDVRKHLELVARPLKDGGFSQKQIQLFQSIYKLINQIRVKRIWTGSGEEKETSNPFIIELYKELNATPRCAELKKLLLDPIFLPTAQNPLRLGLHLRLIPKALFRESIYKHALLPGLASYFTGTWLNEYPVSKGVAAKSTREIIEGCAFNVTPANRYQIVNKVKSELAYMKEKCYISDYNIQENSAGNPWDDLHHVTASENILTGIVEKLRIASDNRRSEKLIA